MNFTITCYWALGEWVYQVAVRYDTTEGHQWRSLPTKVLEVKGRREQDVMRALGVALLRLASVRS